MGETNVPQNPERIVTLDGGVLEAILALDFQPVGVALGKDISEQPPFIKEELPPDIPVLSPGQPSLEKILQLKPDLIVGSKSWNADAYPQLSQIAPTILTETNNEKWQENFLFWGRVLGQSKLAKEKLDNYLQKVESLAEEIKPLGTIKVSVARVFPTQIRLYLKDSFSGHILESLGLDRPSVQDQDRYKIEGISKEKFTLIDGDIMFIITMDQEASKALEELRSDPIWSQLSVVKNNQAYEVGGYWVGANILSANAVLQDIETYLLSQSN
ncbi:UNVERIFIED_CONTAM: hypothetical protein BEN50_10585 [Euhalothece sp. KZN 001]